MHPIPHTVRSNGQRLPATGCEPAESFSVPMSQLAPAVITFNWGNRKKGGDRKRGIANGESQTGDTLLFLLLWPTSGSKRKFKAEHCSRFFLPVSITEWSAASKAVSQGFEFGFCFHTVDMASPLRRLQDRTTAKKSVEPASSCRLQAGPFPVLTALDHVRSQRIALHITQHREIVFIGLDGKRLESPLPDMATALVMPMITANVRRHEPLHPATQVPILMRPQQQVEMVCHQTKTCQPHRHVFMSFSHETHKRREVIILMKDVTASIARFRTWQTKPPRDALDVRGIPEL